MVGDVWVNKESSLIAWFTDKNMWKHKRLLWEKMHYDGGVAHQSSRTHTIA